MCHLSKPLVVFFALIVVGCSVAPPNDQENLCNIFRQYDDWYDNAVTMQEKWGTPIPLAMAFVKQESAFVHDALPPKKYALGFIPWGRVSSAYGYSQALDAAWSDYEKAIESGGTRSNFNDALYFIGWYTWQTHRGLGIEKGDAYNQYLAYHEGRTGFKRGVYHSKPKVKQIARKVEKQVERYDQQLKTCVDELDKHRRLWSF